MSRNRKKFEQYQDLIARLYPELTKHNSSDDQSHGAERVLTRTVTLQVTDKCNLACSYCYQINKGVRRMSLETAKKFIDLLLTGEKGFSNYVDPSFSPAIVLEFIGGEPFLEIELIDKVCDYFVDKAIELRHPWAKNFRFSICSNGVLYRDPKVQKFLNKWKNKLSFSITIDGDKELHDTCRVFPDGSPSYDIAIEGAKDWMAKGNYMGSKITIAPQNLHCFSRALKHMISLGYDEINCNCVYEDVWKPEHGKQLYDQLKETADYLLDNNLEKDIYVSILAEDNFHPKDVNDLQTWCWGKGTPILTTKGYKPIEDIAVGDEVYTPQGHIKPVINVMSHVADNCVEISGCGILPMICTKDHRLWASPFDYRGWKNTPHYKPFGAYSIEEIIDTKYPTRSRIKTGVLPNNRTVHVDPNVAYLLGRTIGDGWVADDIPAVCCGKDELSEVIKCFNDAKIAYRISESNTTYDFYATKKLNMGNDNYALYSKLCLDMGHKSVNKHIPSECFNWDDESLEALLQGYVSADGHIRANRNIYVIKTSSKRLAEDVMLVCRTLGYNPMCDTPQRVNGKTETIMGRLTHRNGDVFTVRWSFEKHNGKFYYEDEDGMFTSKLRVVSAPTQAVYNITVADDHSYIAGSLASKNCGGLGDMLACDPDGKLFPCIRYMESSLGNTVPPVIIGDVDNGVCQRPHEQKLLCDMCAVNRRTYNTDECFYCPIYQGCAECSAYNYQLSGGDFNKRATCICITHKARCLANAYYWSKFYEKNEPQSKFKFYIPDEWALQVIDKDELDMIKSLPNIELCQTTWQELRDKDLNGEDKQKEEVQ